MPFRSIAERVTIDVFDGKLGGDWQSMPESYSDSTCRDGPQSIRQNNFTRAPDRLPYGVPPTSAVGTCGLEVTLMTISTKVYVDHPDLALAPTIRSVDDVEIGVIPDAGTDPEHNVYSFWVEAEDFDAVESAFDGDHTVTDYTCVSETSNRRTYRLAYSDRAILVSRPIVEMDGLMLDTRSHRSGWLLTLQLPDNRTLDRLREQANEDGIQLDVIEIHQTVPEGRQSDLPLTEAQIEALVTAYEHGYYDEPRETSLEELGSFMGISRTAVSGRLKRASSRLIEERLGEQGNAE